MGKVKYANNAISPLVVGVSVGDTEIKVQDAAEFPAVTGGDFIFVSLEIEVYKVIAMDLHTNTLTVDPVAHPSGITTTHSVGVLVELRMTKQLLDAAGDMGEF